MTKVDSNGLILKCDEMIKWLIIDVFVLPIMYTFMIHGLSYLTAFLFIGVIFGMESSMKQW